MGGRGSKRSRKMRNFSGALLFLACPQVGASQPPAGPEDQVRVDAPPYSSKHLKKLFLDRDSVIFTAPPPPGGLLSFCREAKGKDETQSASGRFETGSAAGHTPRCDHRRRQPTIFLLSRLMMSLASMTKACRGRQHATFPPGITATTKQHQTLLCNKPTQ